MHRVMSGLALLSIFFTFGISGRAATAVDGNSAGSVSSSRLVVFEDFSRPT